MTPLLCNFIHTSVAPVVNQLTWSKCLGVANTNKAIVVHFSL